MTNLCIENLYSYKIKEQKARPDFKFYENEKINENFDGFVKKKSIKKYILNYRSPYITGDKKNDEVYCELFLNYGLDNKDNNLIKSKAGELKAAEVKTFKTGESLIIILHGFASKLQKLGNYYDFISKLLNNNINCAFLNQPYHLYRTPRGENSGERLIYFGDIETLYFYHQAVVDVRRLIDIALQKLNFKRIILCGFSLGSMVATITAAVDKRIDKTILLLGGGNWHEIHWNSFLSHILKGNCIKDGKITKEKCKEFYKDFPFFLEEFKNTDISNLDFNLSLNPDLKEKTTKMCFLCDPLAFAHKIDPQKILMINSRLDHYFPKTSAIQLWKELGKPEIFWFTKLHTSKILLNPRVFNIILNFIKN
ncbi:MAG: alpha/beta hydrolase [Actinobacteria bacterium]|nr:alpha/beta hydrolase [Actinomycetota bacterium]